MLASFVLTLHCKGIKGICNVHRARFGFREMIRRYDRYFAVRTDAIHFCTDSVRISARSKDTYVCQTGVSTFSTPSFEIDPSLPLKKTFIAHSFTDFAVTRERTVRNARRETCALQSYVATLPKSFDVDDDDGS